MGPLIKSEFLRFRRLGLGFALAHLLVLKGVSGFTDLFAVSGVKIAVGLLVYAATGLIFGLYQMGSYKKVNQWTYLIHRPLSPQKIFLALAVAAGLWFALVLTLPQLSMTLYLDGLTPQGVDLRHHALIPFLFGLTFSFYLAGCFVALSPHRAAFLVLLLPYFFLTRQAEGLWIFLPQGLVLLWLGWLAYSAFKPDLSTPERRPLVLAASAFPVQYALFWMLVIGTTMAYQSLVVFQEEGWNGYATHAWDDHFPEGTYFHAEYLRGGAALAHGLRGMETEESRYLEKQTELAEVLTLYPRALPFPRRHQLLFADGDLTFADSEGETLWTFRHDRMLFQGRDAVSGAPRGWMGPEGSSEGEGAELAPFHQVPRLATGGYLFTPRHLYEFDGRRRRIDLRFTAKPGERWLTAFQQESSVLVALSNEHLYFFDPRDLEKDGAVLAPTQEVEVPGEVRELSRLHIAELLDGYLVSFLFGSWSEEGYGEARQVVVEVGVDGGRRVVARRALGPGWPEAYRYRAFILSPGMEQAHHLVWSWIAPNGPGRRGLGELAARQVPGPVFLWALLAAGASALLTAHFARTREPRRKARRAWILASFLLGLPAFLSFLLLTRRQEAPRAVAEAPRRRWVWRLAR